MKVLGRILCGGGVENHLRRARARTAAILWSVLCVCLILTCSSILVLAQSEPAPVSGISAAPASTSPSTLEQALPASISGTVVDQDGDVVANVKIILASGSAAPREATSGGDGHFVFANVPAGRFQLSLSASGFAAAQKDGVLQSGQDFVFPQIALLVARADVDVEVKESTAEVAEDQVKEQEKQRLFGVIPNYYVSYVPHAAPLTTKLKFQLAWKSTVDPVSFGITGVIAGIEQAEDAYGGYGQGAQGYAKRYGATYADFVSGAFIGGAILPAVLKQDPRYFWKGTGSTKSRVFYAIANSVICKGDNGRWQANYSAILGGLASGAISNLYYPAQDRNGAALTFENALIGTGFGALGNIVQEFFLRKLTPHVPNQDPPKN